MGKLLDRLKVLPLVRRKNALLFDALRKAQQERDAGRLALEAIIEAAETPSVEAEPLPVSPEAK